MECSVCGNKAVGGSKDVRGVVGWQAFCNAHFQGNEGFLQKAPSEWSEGFVDGRIKFLNRVIDRHTKLLAEMASKGPSKLEVFGEATALLSGNYNAATYWKLSSMNTGNQKMTVQQSLQAEIDDAKKQLADLEALKRGEPLPSQAGQKPAQSEDPKQILKVRFAKGEITKEQYDEMLKVL
jgi:hypothetical protein